ncbi:MAG TPA: hypothetical protein VK751_18685 [Undibacterium sp.]|nr:hypothetical protein [Undibacterium sp.]
MREKALKHASGDRAAKHKTAVTIRKVSSPLCTTGSENRISNEYAIPLSSAAHDNAAKNITYQLLLAIGSTFKLQSIQSLLSTSVGTTRFPDDGASAKEYFKQHNIDTDLVELVALCSNVGIQRLSTAANRHLKSA